MLKQNLITNDVFNTDKFGFRYTLIVLKKFTILDDIDKNENEEQIAELHQQLLVSVSHQIKKTISSYLTNFSNKRVYNL